MGLYPRIETSHLANQLRGLRSNNWYVHGADGNDSSPGDRPEKPLATLQEALDRCNNGDYDTIFVTRGVVTGETTPFLCDKANVRIIGDPHAVDGSSTNCAVIATGDTDCFNIGAADVTISGFALYAGATHSGIVFEPLAWMQRVLIEKCSFMAGAYGVLSLNEADAPYHHFTVQDCFFNPAGNTSGGISYGSNGSWPIFRRNHFDLIAGAPCIYVWGSGHVGGRIQDNTFVLVADAAGSAITVGANATRYMITNNIANDAAQDAITANPFVDTPGTSVWSRNVKGAAGYTDAEPT